MRVVEPDTTDTFERRVFRAYATEGVAIPRSVTDSIAKLADPRRMQRAMDEYMERHDSIVRENLAARYGISLDSLRTIIRLYDSASRK